VRLFGLLACSGFAQLARSAQLAKSAQFARSAQLARSAQCARSVQSSRTVQSPSLVQSARPVQCTSSVQCSGPVHKRFGVRAALLGLTLCSVVCLLAESISIAQQAQVRSAIYANVASSIEIEAPVEIQWADLAIGINESPVQRINVKSNQPYSLKMRSVTRTHLAEYDLVSQEFISGGKSLSETLMWRLADPASETRAISRTDVVIRAANPPTRDSGENFDICFVQEVGYGDERLPDGKAYRIDVIFTAVQDV
jgi:hypothetical protein